MAESIQCQSTQSPMPVQKRRRLPHNIINQSTSTFKISHAYRLITFRFFPAGDIVAPLLLAENGFIYIGSGSDDSVMCIVCHKVKENWKLGDVVADVHRDISPNCPMVTGLVGSCRQIASTGIQNQHALEFSRTAKAGAFSDTTIQTDAAPGIAQSTSKERHNVPISNLQFLNSGTAKPWVENNRSNASPIENNALGDARSNTCIVAQATEDNPQSTFLPSSANNEAGRPSLTEPQESAREMPRSAPALQSVAINSETITPRPDHTQPPSTPTPNASSSTGLESDEARGNSRQSQASGTGSQEPPLANGSSSENKNKSPTYSELGIITERPKRTEYALKIKRMDTFGTWPRDHHLRPEELSDAGFYYAGYGDCTRCFYCGGGLRNWEDEDDVWVEHARWFPKCAFIRQQMGQVFVDTVQDLNKVLEQIPFQKVADKMGVSMSTFRIFNKDTQLKHDPAVLAVVELGFSEKDALDVATRIKEEYNMVSADTLVDQLKEEGCSRNTGSDLIIPYNTQLQNIGDETLRQLKESNNQLRQQIVCKICMDKEVAVVFLPCGHLISCADCALAMKDCPLCRHNVRGVVRAFIS